MYCKIDYVIDCTIDYVIDSTIDHIIEHTIDYVIDCTIDHVIDLVKSMGHVITLCFSHVLRVNILARCMCDFKMSLSVAQLLKARRAIEYLSSFPVWSAKCAIIRFWLVIIDLQIVLLIRLPIWESIFESLNPSNLKWRFDCRFHVNCWPIYKVMMIIESTVDSLIIKL